MVSLIAIPFINKWRFFFNLNKQVGQGVDGCDNFLAILNSSKKVLE
jgi:hypothetical protein